MRWTEWTCGLSTKISGGRAGTGGLRAFDEGGAFVVCLQPGRLIARELVETVRNNVTIDWTLRENVRAQLRVLVKRILRKHGYPPDKQEKATQTVLEQAEACSAEWVVA